MGTVDLGGGPEFAVADGSGYVYNNLEDASVALKINARSLKVEQRWPTAPCASPSSISMDCAFDADSRLVFNSNGEGTITVIREDSPDKYSVVENVKTLPKAKTMALDPRTHRLFLSTAGAGQFGVLVVGQ